MVVNVNQLVPLVPTAASQKVSQQTNEQYRNDPNQTKSQVSHDKIYFDLTSCWSQTVRPELTYFPTILRLHGVDGPVGREARSGTTATTQHTQQPGKTKEQGWIAVPLTYTHCVGWPGVDDAEEVSSSGNTFSKKLSKDLFTSSPCKLVDHTVTFF